jgi:general secretion pathway protein N
MSALFSRILIGFIAGLALLTTALWFAPASWADGIFNQATSGRLRLTDTQGTLWRGSGRLVLGQLGISEVGTAPSESTAVVNGVVIPGRCDWVVQALPLFWGQINIQLRLESMREPVRLTGNHRIIQISAAQIDLPQVRLDRLGSPWNTIQPDAALSVRWESLFIEQGMFKGKAVLSVAQVASALSTVRPLGSYQIDIDSNGRQAQIIMTTVAGPLQIDGQGDWAAKSGLRFTAYAQAQAERPKLLPLLSLLGKRDGERTVIRLGAV